MRLRLTCELGWMSVEQCSTSTCPVGRLLTKLQWRAYPHAMHSGRMYRPE